MVKLIQGVLLVCLLVANVVLSNGKALQPEEATEAPNHEAQVNQLRQEALVDACSDETGQQSTAITQPEGIRTEALLVAASEPADDEGANQVASHTEPEDSNHSSAQVPDQDHISAGQAEPIDAGDQIQEAQVGELVSSSTERAAAEPEIISFDSDIVESEEDFERVLESLRRLADGNAIHVEPTTTVPPSTTRRPGRTIVRTIHLGNGGNQHHVVRDTDGRFEVIVQGDGTSYTYVGNNSGIEITFEHPQSYSQIEAERNRERLLADPNNIRKIEEFLRSRMEQKASGSNARVSGQDQPLVESEGYSIAQKARDGGDDCQICMDPNTPENSVKLDCGHAFHFGCLKSWFSTKIDKPVKTCPVCRRSHWIGVSEAGRQ